jgi:hypothetical protein
LFARRQEDEDALSVFGSEYGIKEHGQPQSLILLVISPNILVI